MFTEPVLGLTFREGDNTEDFKIMKKLVGPVLAYASV